MDLHRKRRRPMAEINVVPYIDVMLVLLIVFMVTAPLLTQGLRVDLPPAASQPLEFDENRESLVISITAENEFYLSLGATAEDQQQAVTLETVADQVGRIVNANPGIQIFVEGDDRAGYGSFIRLMTVLQNAGIDSPNLVTRPLDP
jgi:biopolymer transport protein TolR